MAGGEHGGERIDSAELRARIVELRRRRLTFAQIAAEVGRAESTVWDHYQAAMKDIPAAVVSVHRQEMLDQIDEAEHAVLAVLHTQHITVSQGRVVRDDDGSTVVDDGPILDAARTLVTLQARKAKLLGADAPTQVSQDVTVNYTVGGGINPAADLT